MDMSSNRPYLIRAYYDWIVDNDCTPHVVVDTEFPEVSVPQTYATDGQIVLNIAPRAIKNFSLDNEALCFNTRFGGVPCDIYIPILAITGIYARENGQGMAFQTEWPVETKTEGGILRSVEEAVSGEEKDAAKTLKKNPEKPSTENTDDEPPKPPTPSKGGHPHLRVVK